MELDMGVQCDVLPKQEASEMGSKMVPSKIKNIICYINRKFSVVWEAQEFWETSNERARLTFIILGAPVTPVLEQTACETPNLVKRVRLIETPGADDRIFQMIGRIKDYVYEAPIE